MTRFPVHTWTSLTTDLLTDAAAVRRRLEEVFGAQVPALRHHAPFADASLAVSLSLYDSLVATERALDRQNPEPGTDHAEEDLLRRGHDFLVRLCTAAINEKQAMARGTTTPGAATWVPVPPLTKALARDVAAVFRQHPATQALTCAALAKELAGNGGRWSDHGPAGFTPDALADLMSPLANPRDIEAHGRTEPGYLRDDFLRDDGFPASGASAEPEATA